MAITRTRQELAIAVMRELGSLDASQTPTADDAAYIKGVYDDKYEWWVDEEQVYWEPDEIPKAIFLIVRDLIVNEVAGAFGNPQPPEERQARDEVLMARLRRHTARAPSGARTEAEYY